LKRFLCINIGEVKEKRCQLFEPAGRVLASPGTSLRFIKNRFRASEKWLGQHPVNNCVKKFLGLPLNLLENTGNYRHINADLVAFFLCFRIFFKTILKKNRSLDYLSFTPA